MTIGYLIMTALLGAGAAYGLSNRNKPKPVLSSTRKNVAIICFSVAFGCGLLLLAVIAVSSHATTPH